MSVEIPEDLQNLEANGGIFAIWMIFHHYGIDLNISDLTQLCQHDLEMGSSSIALAVALKTLGWMSIFILNMMQINSQLKSISISKPIA